MHSNRSMFLCHSQTMSESLHSVIIQPTSDSIERGACICRLISHVNKNGAFPISFMNCHFNMASSASERAVKVNCHGSQPIRFIEIRTSAILPSVFAHDTGSGVIWASRLSPSLPLYAERIPHAVDRDVRSGYL